MAIQWKYACTKLVVLPTYLACHCAVLATLNTSTIAQQDCVYFDWTAVLRLQADQRRSEIRATTNLVESAVNDLIPGFGQRSTGFEADVPPPPAHTSPPPAHAPPSP